MKKVFALSAVFTTLMMGVGIKEAYSIPPNMPKPDDTELDLIAGQDEEEESFFLFPSFDDKHEHGSHSHLDNRHHSHDIKTFKKEIPEHFSDQVVRWEPSDDHQVLVLESGMRFMLHEPPALWAKGSRVEIDVRLSPAYGKEEEPQIEYTIQQKGEIYPAWRID